MTINPLPAAKVIGLFVGKPEKLWSDLPQSAITKKPAFGKLLADQNGFLKDKQADLLVHGGPEKAIHHYAFENMEFWRNQFPDFGGRFVAGCFGENLSTIGFDENNLHLGDIIEAGSLILQVCQGRQPCWKLAAKLGIEELPFIFRQSGRTGWYYRVLQDGALENGNEMKVVLRLLPDWPLKRLNAARFGKNPSKEEVEFLKDCQELAPEWRKYFNSRARKE